MSETKVCTKCGVEKTIDDFYADKRSAGGRQTKCKVCFREMTEAYRKGHMEKYRDIARAKREADPEGCNAAARERRAKNLEHHREIGRRADLKRREKKKAYRESNKEQIKAKNAAYRAEHKEEIDAYNKAYRESKKELLRIRHKQWREDNPEANREIHKRWKSANKASVNAATHRRRVLISASAAGHYTVEEWEALKEAQGYICLCCGRKEPEILLTVDHVIPVIKGGCNAITNIQGLCKSCNCSKHSDDTDYREIATGRS